MCFLLNSKATHMDMVYSDFLDAQFQAIFQADASQAYGTPSIHQFKQGQMYCIAGYMYNFACGSCRENKFRLGTSMTSRMRSALTSLKGHICTTHEKNSGQKARRVYDQGKNKLYRGISWVMERTPFLSLVSLNDSQKTSA